MSKKTKVGEEQRNEVFAEVYARTGSPKQAMLAAEPALEDRPHYTSIKAARTLQKPDVQDKISKKLEKMSVKAVKNIEKLMSSDDEGIATTNNWRVLEQVRGKAVTRSLNINATTTIEDALFN